MKYSLFFLVFIAFSCGNSEIKTENFKKFNAKFHSDSLFQISRINFPIDGKHIMGFSKEIWTKENWQILKKPIGGKVSKEFVQKTEITDSIVIEKIEIPNSGFHTEVRFKRIKYKWYLVYYNDVEL